MASLNLLRSVYIAALWLAITQTFVWTYNLSAAVNTKTQQEQQKDFKEANPDSLNNINLFFDPLKNKVEMPNQSIEYDLTLGNILKIGPLNLPTSALQASAGRELAVNNSVDILADPEKVKEEQLVTFTWPLDFVIAGKLELIGDDDIPFWSKDLTDEAVFDWVTASEKRIGDRTEQKNRADFLRNLETLVPYFLQKDVGMPNPGIKVQSLKRSHWGSSFGLVGSSLKEVPFAKLLKPFRFCLRQNSDNGLLAVCSQRYRADGTPERFTLKTSNRYFQPKVYINDSELTLRGTAVFLDNRTRIKFAALLSDGSYYEFVSGPKPVNIIDMIFDMQKKDVEVIGYGNPPMGRVEVIRRENKNFWEILNFMPTIGDFRNFWKAKFDASAPHLFLRGFGGAPFKQEFIFNDLPQARHRTFLKGRNPTSTYSPTVDLIGEKASSEMKITSQQKRVREQKNNDFLWTFQSPKKNMFNRSYLQVDDGKGKWNAYYEIYRGAPREIAIRGNFVLSSELQVIAMGEVGASYWFEDVLGWSNFYAARQRWGITARYFQSFATVALKKTQDASGETIEANDFKLGVLDANIKYRFTPGVWAHDATIGVLGAVQSVDYTEFSDGFKFDTVVMLGGGGFWARSMPAIFDRIFNIIPFLRYPKWVNAEFIWYPLSLDKDQQLESNFALNFYGKIRWSDRLFGEAGFGIKNYQWRDFSPNIERGTKFGLAYSTLGLGYNF